MTKREKGLMRKLGEKLKKYGFTQKEIREAKVKELEKIRARDKKEKAKLLETAVNEIFDDADNEEEGD